MHGLDPANTRTRMFLRVRPLNLDDCKKKFEVSEHRPKKKKKPMSESRMTPS